MSYLLKPSDFLRNAYNKELLNQLKVIELTRKSDSIQSVVWLPTLSTSIPNPMPEIQSKK